MKRSLVLFLLLACPVLGQQPPAPKDGVVFSDPQAPPSPPIPAGRPVQLDASQLYVIRSDFKCTVVASPEGVVDIATEAGPVKIRAIFTDTGSKYITRSFTEKNLWLITAAAKGQCEIIVMVPDGTIIRKKIVVGDAPIPPDPGPGPKPPDPGPTPIPVDGFKVVVVYESADLSKIPLAQTTLLNSATWREYARSKGEWRAIDKDVSDIGNDKQWVKDVLKRPRASTPWVIVSNGKTGYEGPLPANLDAMMALLKKYGD